MKYEVLLEKLDKQRKGVIRNFILCFFAILVFILGGYLLYDEIGLLIGWIIGLIGSILILYYSVTHYKKVFKTNLMPLLDHKTEMSIIYQYDKGLTQERVMSSQLFKTPDRFVSEDLMYGSFDGIDFKSSDVRLQQFVETIDKKGRETITYANFFAGQWYVFDLHKELKSTIQLRETLINLEHPLGLDVKKIELEDVDFNDKFQIYTTNEINTKDLFTPILREKIKELETRYPGKVYFSFTGTALHVAIYDLKNNYEPPYLNPINNEYIEEQVKEIIVLKEIVEELIKNKNIFK